jgi:hypothetical protein
MSKVSGALASVDGAKVEAVNDDSGLPAIRLTFDAGIVSATGTNELTEAAKTQLSKLATVLVENKTVAVEVTGHSDNSKWRNTSAQQSVQKNLELSEKRARAVVNYLKTRGVADSQFRLVEGKGESVPVADNTTIEGRAANRRVEVFLLPGSQMITDAIAESRPVRTEPVAVAASSRASSETAQQSLSTPAKASARQGFTRGDLIIFARTSGFKLEHYSIHNYSTTDFKLHAGAGIFVTDKLAITGELQINVLDDDYDIDYVNDLEDVSSFAFGVGARFYFLKGLYAGAKITGAKIKDYDDVIGHFDIEAGYDIFLNDHVFFEPSLQFSKGLNLSEFDVADGLTTTLSIGIGVRF